MWNLETDGLQQQKIKWVPFLSAKSKSVVGAGLPKLANWTLEKCHLLMHINLRDCRRKSGKLMQYIYIIYDQIWDHFWTMVIKLFFFMETNSFNADCQIGLICCKDLATLVITQDVMNTFISFLHIYEDIQHIKQEFWDTTNFPCVENGCLC